MEFVEFERWRNRRRTARRSFKEMEVRKGKMEYKRLKNQLRIHWSWLKEKQDDEVYLILKKWIDTDMKNEKVAK